MDDSNEGVKKRFIVIVENSAGNETVGEMWKETKVFLKTHTLEDVMKWALKENYGSFSRKQITITKPHED